VFLYAINYLTKNCWCIFEFMNWSITS
jgi:hypothetical protein